MKTKRRNSNKLEKIKCSISLIGIDGNGDNINVLHFSNSAFQATDALPLCNIDEKDIILMILERLSKEIIFEFFKKLNELQVYQGLYLKGEE